MGLWSYSAQRNRKNNGEFGLIYLCYNFRRIINILGIDEVKKRLKEWFFQILNIWRIMLRHSYIKKYLSINIHTAIWFIQISSNLVVARTAVSGKFEERPPININRQKYGQKRWYLAKTSKDVDGNGWGILGYQPYTDKLTIYNVKITKS